MPEPFLTLPADTPEHQAFTVFAGLTDRKRELEAELKEIEGQLKVLQPQLLAYFAESGFKLVRLERYTISPIREPWVYPAQGQDRQSVIEALKACGMGHYVFEQYNTKSLTKYVRELEDGLALTGQSEADALANVLKEMPPELAGVIEIKPSFHIQARRR